MEVYRSEEEQVEALKKWWKENGRSMIFGFAIGIAMVIGWNVWQSNRQTKSEQASDLYEQLLNAVQQQRTESALKLSERLTDRHGNTPYSMYANFFIAKLRMEQGEPSTAITALNAILESAADDNFKHIARLRLIRLHAASGDPQAGLTVIANTDIALSGEFEGRYEELRGDLYVQFNKDAEARAAYQRAQQLGEKSPYLQIKLDDLAAPNVSELSR